MTIEVKETMDLQRDSVMDHTAWAEIDFKKLRKNIQVVRAHIGYGKKIIAVIKSDAYGHGAVQVAEALAKEGVNFFAVANLDEGIQLRTAGIRGNILVMSSIDPSQAHCFFDYDLTPSIFSLAFARKLQRIAERRKCKMAVHLRIDLASGNFGVFPSETMPLVNHILTMDNLNFEGVYTHLSSSYGEDIDQLEEEITCFNQMVVEIQQRAPISIIHASSSPAVIKRVASHLEYVRIGTVMYGLPSLLERGLDVEPVMQLKARVQDVKTLPLGISKGYNYQIKVEVEKRVAIIPLGYADAFYLLFQREGFVLINGQRAAIIGHAYMSHLLVDISKIDDVRIGDEAVFIGEQGDLNITAADVAKKSGIGVTNCESICLLGKNVPLIGVE